ncbi:biotin--[acetyl-CoA-carboxylase] ligase [Algirhabdus cladophorae]|uniref:biotin--[acetyl-CoA-carboxylase] ligase n=1 Tax=Algirhabdus cladophorae TaxID=3377108 RepID=UPI003B847A14
MAWPKWRRPHLSTDPAASAHWPQGVDCVVLDEVDSTMAEARRRAPTITAPLWILANAQTAAHGRRGRAWANPKGNFAATLVMPVSGPPADWALRSFSMAIALRYTLAMCVSPDSLTLKWPNDVLISGGKVAGILLETSGTPQQGQCLSIGVGVNLIKAPMPQDVEEGAFRPVAVAEHGTPHGPEDFLIWLANHFATAEDQFNTFGFDIIRKLWLRNAARLGEVITARTARDQITGTFETVDAAGNLVLKTSKGVHAIPAADVYF